MNVPKSPPPDLPGFTFQRGVGAGGFADVHLYTQHSTGRSVAVKVLRDEHLSAESLSQFQTEANVMAGVSTHPYIVTIHDAGVAPDGRPYIVMEHYPNPHFGTRAAGGRLAVAEVLRVAVQVCAAVETAHRARILHRDIKPANILTSAYNDPGLTDFGIAGVQVEGAMSAASGLSLGYAAPEVILDDSATGSVASDVYSLSATIFALLVGRSPFYQPGGDNSRGSFAARVTTGTPGRLDRGDVPRTLAHLISAGMSLDPGNRPAGAVALGQALQEIEQSLHLPPTPLVLVGDTSTRTARRPEGEDHDGTRRRPIVVDSDGPPTPPPTPRTPPAPSPAPAGTVARTSGRLHPPSPDAGDGIASLGPGQGEEEGGRTVLRGAGARHGPAPAEVEPTERSRRAAVTVVIGLVAVLIVGVGLSHALGSEEDTTTTTTPAARVEPQDPGFTGVLVPVPADLRAERTPEGIELTWTMPDTGLDGEAVGYRVVRTDDGDPDNAFGTAEQPLRVPQILIPTEEVASGGPGGEVCFAVRAIVGSTTSPEAATTCVG